jgi:N-carbamoylputrescine amidase
MTALVLAALAGHFGRDIEANMTRIEAVLADAGTAGAALVVLPDAALGGYLPRFDTPPGGGGPDGGGRDGGGPGGGGSDGGGRGAAGDVPVGRIVPRPPEDLPPALDPDGPEIARLIRMAGSMTVCVGYCERAASGKVLS